MITERYFERDNDRVLFRLAVNGSAVLDILTDDATLSACRELLDSPSGPGFRSVRMGSFGPFDITMSLHADRSTVSIFIDGPDLEDRFRGNQSAGFYLARGEMLAALDETVEMPRVSRTLDLRHQLFR